MNSWPENSCRVEPLVKLGKAWVTHRLYSKGYGGLHWVPREIVTSAMLTWSVSGNSKIPNPTEFKYRDGRHLQLQTNRTSYQGK